MNKKISDLKAAVYNPRKISEEQLEMLKKSMRKFGDLSGIVYNIKTGHLIGGHQRVKTFDHTWPLKIKKLPKPDKVGTVASGIVKTPYGDWAYREVRWNETKEKAANIAANQHGGEWDMDLLPDLLKDLKDLDFDMDLTGFGEKELESFLNPKSKKSSTNNNAGKLNLEEKHAILVECKDESEQRDLRIKFTKDGIKCKPMMILTDGTLKPVKKKS